jgi:hypothetical protein
MLRPEGASETGHSNILWTGLLTEWYCSTSVNLHHHSRLRIIRQRNKGGMKESECATHKEKRREIWLACSMSQNSEFHKLLEGNVAKNTLFKNHGYIMN